VAYYVINRTFVFVLPMSAQETKLSTQELSSHITVLRHPKENMIKNSLRPFRHHPRFTWVIAHPESSFDATGYITLAVGQPPLSTEDAGLPILLLESTWHLVPQLLARMSGKPIYRSLPENLNVRTASQRRSILYQDPEQGLCSVEALFVTRWILEGQCDLSLLDSYHWKDVFLSQFADLDAKQPSVRSDIPPLAIKTYSKDGRKQVEQKRKEVIAPSSSLHSPSKDRPLGLEAKM